MSQHKKKITVRVASQTAYHIRETAERLGVKEGEVVDILVQAMDKPLSFYAFEMLYWCGIREGELLALTPADFDFEKGTVSINKSYQRLNGQDLITTPKTEKSNRVITMPQFLAEEIQDYIKMLYGIGPDDRMFTVTKSYVMLDTVTKDGVRYMYFEEPDCVKSSTVSMIWDER